MVTGFPLGVMSVPELMVGTVTQPCEYIKNTDLYTSKAWILGYAV